MKGNRLLYLTCNLQLNNNIIIMDLYTHIIIGLPYIINMAPYTEIIKRHHTVALKTSNGVHGYLTLTTMSGWLGWRVEVTKVYTAMNKNA